MWISSDGGIDAGPIDGDDDNCEDDEVEKIERV
jgi:hypothetical protein